MAPRCLVVIKFEPIVSVPPHFCTKSIGSNIILNIAEQKVASHSPWTSITQQWLVYNIFIRKSILIILNSINILNGYIYI